MDIQVLTGLEPIRRRPGMYIGNTDASGLFHILIKLVTNSLAEAVAGYGRSVRVTLQADDSAAVADDGRPPPNVETAFAELDGHHGYCPYPGGREYFAYPVANALSERLTVFAHEDGSVYQHAFRRGVTHTAFRTWGPPGGRGMNVIFLPDPQIFGEAHFDVGAIRDRLRQLAFLHSGVRITFADEAAGTRDEFEYADGIRECVRHLNADRVPLHPEVILIRGEEEGVRYEVGLQWCAGDEEVRRSFANHRHTTNGGTHDRGVCLGVAAAMRDVIRESQPSEFTGEDLRVGLTAVVSVWLREPMFESATWSRLSNPEVEGVVKAVVRRDVREYFEANRDVANRVVDAVILVRDARLAAAARKRKGR